MPDLPWFVYAVPLAMVGVIAVAAIYKWLQVRAAAHWPSAPGKVVVSAPQVRKVKTFDDERQGGRSEEARNFANVIYEYKVSGQTLRNNRVSIGEDLGNFEVEETLARYPVGTVVTVYYNPRRPRDAVLERDPPKGLWGCVIWMVVISTALILGSFFGFNQITLYLQGKGEVQNAPMVVALAAMGLVTLLFGIGLRRRASAARKWPQVTGQILTSKVDEFRGRIKDNSPLTTLYRPEISFRYEFNGVTYTGSQVTLGMKVTSSSDGFAKRIVAKYPAGKTFTIYVNPENPSEALLSPSVGGAWLIWGAAAGLLALAYYASQHG